MARFFQKIDPAAISRRRRRRFLLAILIPCVTLTGVLTKRSNEMISLESLIMYAIIGAIAGWLAGLVMRGRGFGFIGNLIIGIVGAVLGGFLLHQFGLHYSRFIAEVAVATFGAILFVYLLGFVRR